MQMKSIKFSLLSLGLGLGVSMNAQAQVSVNCEALEDLSEKLTCFQEVTALEELRANYAEALQRKLSANSSATELQAEILANRAKLRLNEFENERVETEILLGRDELLQKSQALSQRKLSRARKVSLEDLANGNIGPAETSKPAAAPAPTPPREKPLVRRVTGVDDELTAFLEWPNGQRARAKAGTKLPDGGRIAAINLSNVVLKYGDTEVIVGVGERQLPQTTAAGTPLPPPPVLR